MKQLPLTEARTYLIDRARALGLHLEVYGERTTSTTVQAFGGVVDEFKLSSLQGLGLRVLSRGAWGNAYTENFSPEALDRTLQLATENAELTAPVPQAALHAWGAPPELDLHGEGLSGVSVEQKVEVAIALERAARGSDPRVQSVPYATYRDREEIRSVDNTEGLQRDYQSLSALVFAAPLVAENGQHKMKTQFQFTREFTRLDPTQTALEATRKALALMGAKPSPSGRFPVVIAAECMGLLLAVYSEMFSAKQVLESKSPLAGRLGEQVGSSAVTLIDDPTRVQGLQSRPFDVEGHPSAPLTLIAGGQLRSYLHNSETAARLGVPNTGHASRDTYRSSVDVSASNLILSPGQASPDELLVRMGTGVLLTDVQGVHAGASLVTGDFSLQAEGFWVEDGRIAFPLDVFTVAGNFLDLLGDVQAVANDLTTSQYGVDAASVLLTGLSVGGASGERIHD